VTAGIVIEGAGKRFGRVEALKGLSATIGAGRLAGLVGPDGAGKTTLMRMLAGLMTPGSGRIEVAGLDVARESAALSRVTGYMPQRFGLYEELSVEENLRLYADLRGLDRSSAGATFKRLLEFTDLARFTDRQAGRLSGGMKQKLGLACALMAQPRVLLLDEPSVGVDPVSRRELWAMVEELTGAGMTVVWATAYLDEAERCDEVLLLQEGELVYSGLPSRLTDRLRGRSFLVSGLSGDRRGFLTRALAEDAVRDGVIQGTSVRLVLAESASAAALLRPSEGRAEVAGVELRGSGADAKSMLGYMAQKFSLYGLMSVRQNLEFFSGIYGLGGDLRRRRIREMIEVFNLGEFLDESPDKLSLGFRQRMALACALMHRPRVLFLDEPTSGVDPITRREFWTHITGLVARGVTVLVTTHFMEEAEYCDRVALIDRGRLIALDTPDGLKARAATPERPEPTMEEAFIQLVLRRDAPAEEAA